MFKSGSAFRFNRIWNVSTDKNTGKHVEVGIRRGFSEDFILINFYQYQGSDEYPTGISLENAEKFKCYNNLKIYGHDISALYKCMPELIEDKSDVIISIDRDRYTGLPLAAYVETLEDKTENFVIGYKEFGNWVEKLEFTTSEILKLQLTLSQVVSSIGTNEPMEH